MNNQISIQKNYLFLINQVFEIEQKTLKIKEQNSILRNVNKVKELFENGFFYTNAALTYENPLGQKYDENRIDCEASIAGESTENLRITEVIKPIIRIKQNGITSIVQKAVVVVESKK